MTPIVDAIIRSSLVLALGLGARAILRHRSAALRHCVLATAMICAVAVVPLSLVLPQWAVRTTTIAAPPPLSPAASVTTTTSAPSTAHSARPAPRLNPWWLISFVWIAGICGRAARLVVGLRRLASITARAERLRDGEWTRLVEQASATQSVGRQVAVLETAAPKSEEHTSELQSQF